MLLLLSTLTLACDPAPTDLLESTLRDGAVDVHPEVRLPLTLGDLQAADPDLVIEILDADGDPVPLLDDIGYNTAENFSAWVRTVMLEPASPLVPGGTYTLSADAPASERVLDVSFTVGEAIDRGRPPAPSVEIRSQEDIEDDECQGQHRLLQITLDPGFVDEATLVWLFVHEQDTTPDLEGRPSTLRETVGQPATLRFAHGLPDVDAITCATAFTEDAKGQRSEATTHCFDPEEPGTNMPGVEEPGGCGCTSTPAPLSALLLLPALLLTLRRRTR